MTGMWTRRDAAHQNASDTCTEEGKRPETPGYAELYEEVYRATLAMVIDCAEGAEYTPECDACERLPYPRKCAACR